MLERSIIALHLVDPAGLEPAALRDRLKPNFPPGAGRRMTLLGMMVGTAVKAVATAEIETFVYASEYGESISLENYLRSFPSPSPTLFQTSIHPSGVQQGLILRQQPVRELIPLAGGPELPLQAALACLTNPAPKVLWCGGEESGTWLRDIGVAAPRSFAFALVLATGTPAGALGRIRLSETSAAGKLTLPDWYDILQRRQAWQGPVGSGWQLGVDWT